MAKQNTDPVLLSALHARVSAHDGRGPFARLLDV